MSCLQAHQPKLPQENPYIVSVDWLQNHLNDDNLRIVDASWYLPKMNRNGFKEYEQAHILGAVFFDHDKLSDPHSHLPHSLPNASYFAQAMGALGISEKNTIVVYDGDGFFSAPRAWWMLRIMGAKKVYVLDGGFKAWQAEGYSSTHEKTIIIPTNFIVQYDGSQVVYIDEMRHIVAQNTMSIADARIKKRFSGEEKEPRAGVRSGHMPHAKNVPYSSLVDEGRFKSSNEVIAVFKNAGVDPLKPVVTTCGSGITAAVLTLALQGLGNHQVKLYDGSWSEWGALSDSDVVCDKE